MPGITSRNPYVGPRPIQQGEPLYGRSTEIAELYHRVQARRIVVLHSPSGAGKSSLVQAGLIPKLREGKFDVWKPIRVNLDPRGLEGLREGTNRYLLSALLSLEEELPLERRRPPSQLAELDLLAYLEARPRRKGREHSPVVLLFDQFEEVLTVAPRALSEKRAFFEAVGNALDTEKYWALFIIREDYLAAFAPYRDRIPTQMSNTFRLDLLGLDGAREAAEKPANAGGRVFPAVEQLIRDLSTVQVQQADGTFVEEQGLYVEPVQLQVVCRRLWEAMPEDDLSIDAEDIEKYARVTTALGGYYADAVARIAGGDVAVERAMREWVGNKLIVGGIRSQVRQEAGKSAGLDNGIIDGLLGSYLVRTEQRAGASWFELSHDRLVEPVLQDNQAWEEAHLHALQAQAKIWEAGKRAQGLLMSAEALPVAMAWAAKHAEWVTEGEREFLEQSRVLRAADRAARWRSRLITAVALMVAAVVGVLGVVAWVQRGEAIRAQKAAMEAQEEAQRQKGVAEDEAKKAKLAQKEAMEAQSVAVTAEQTAQQERAAAVEQKGAADKAKDLAVTEEKNARRASQMASTRELVALGRLAPAAMVLAAMESAEKTRGWGQVATDLLAQVIPRTRLIPGGKINSVAWSPDSQRILVASDDKTAQVWNADGLGKPLILEGHGGRVNSAAWSPDGRRIVSASDDKTVRIWNTDGSGKSLILNGHEGGVNSAAWSPDGKHIATTGWDGTARVWNVDGAGDPLVLKDHNGVAFESVAWSPDGVRIVILSTDKRAQVWNADGSGAPVVLGERDHSIYSVAWSPNSQHILTGVGTSAATIWNADGSGKPLVLKARQANLEVVAWSPNGERVVAAFDDGTAQISNADGSGEPLIFLGQEGRVNTAMWSPDGKRIVTSAMWKKTARIWNTDGTGEPLLLQGHEDRVDTAMWSPDGKRIVTVSGNKTLRIWNAHRADASRVLTGHSNPVRSAAWNPNGKQVITASSDGSVRIWDVGGGEATHVLMVGTRSIRSVAWSPDGKRFVAAGTDNTAHVWNVDGWSEFQALKGHTREIFSVAWSPDGKRIVTASDDKTARVWNADGSGDPIILQGHGSRVRSAAFSPDGKRIVTASYDRTVRIWNADVASEALSVFRGYTDWVIAAAWSPDGKRIVTTSQDKTVRIWNADGSRKPLILHGHEGGVNSAAWSPDGKSVVTASDDGTARVWNADGSGEPWILKGHMSAIPSVAWSPDGTRILTASYDHTARIWLVTIPTLQQALRAATTDCLTAEQRQTYLAEDEPEARKAYEACERSHGRTPR